MDSVRPPLVRIVWLGLAACSTTTARAPDAGRPDAAADAAIESGNPFFDASFGTFDATLSDAPTHPRLDAHAPDAALPMFTCNPSQLVTLKDLADAGADGGQTFGTGELYVVSGSAGPVVVTRLASSPAAAVAFQLSTTGGAPSALPIQGLATAGLELLDVHGGPGGVLALTTYAIDAGSANGLQLVTLPGTLPSGPGDAGTRGLALGWLGHESAGYRSARFVELSDSGSARAPAIAYVAVESEGDAAARTVVFGNGPDGGEAVAYRNDAGGSVAVTSGFFSSGTDLYDLAPSENEFLDGVVLAATDTLADAGLRGLIRPPGSGLWSLLGARASALHPGAVVVIALTAPTIAGPFTLAGATVPTADLPGLVIGDPLLFSEGASESMLGATSNGATAISSARAPTRRAATSRCCGSRRGGSSSPRAQSPAKGARSATSE